jgi:hypothetical protein
VATENICKLDLQSEKATLIYKGRQELGNQTWQVTDRPIHRSFSPEGLMPRRRAEQRIFFEVAP